MSRRLSLILGATLTILAMAAILAALAPIWGGQPIRFEAFGDELEILAPERLLAIAVAPLVVWFVVRSLSDLPPLQRALAALLRIALIAVLTLAVARLARTTETNKVSTVFLVDVSDSVTDEALEGARKEVARAVAERDDHEVHLVTFARDARAIPIEDGKVPPLERHRDDPRAGSGSNLAGALQLSYGLFSPGHLRRVVLFSDGDQTDGDLLAEAGRAARFRVKIHHHVYEGGTPKEVAIRDLSLPDDLNVGEPFRVRAQLFSSTDTTARVRLYQGETLNGLDGVRDIEVKKGESTIEFESIVRVAGPVTYRLELEPKGADRFTANNRFETAVVVPGKPSILYVEGAAGKASYFAQALTAQDFEVEVRSPRGIPENARELERFDFFVLSDVAADEVSLGQLDAIERYVRDLGGGFMMAGGESSFGLGGWQGTRMERLLPVRLDSERRRDQPNLALGLVVDKSGSMNGQKMELAKEAAKATAELLGPDDYISVVGFDTTPVRVVRMQSARNRIGILRDIGRLTARGGTAIFPALDMAYQDLAVTRAKIKHVILLTDGQSPERGIEELVQAMRAETITVSSVGLGADVNRKLLQKVASLGGGRAYFTNDPHNVPRIFMKETSTVARSSAVEEYFQPILVARADFLRGIDLRTAPYLHGYVATRQKPLPAQVILESELGEPILARWRVGLGWVLAWTSDIKNRWAVEWLRWQGYPKFFAQLTREHMRKQRRTELPIEAEVLGEEVRVVVNAVGQDDKFLNDLDSRVTLTGPMGAKGKNGSIDKTLPLRQSAPGRYEARIPLHRYGSFVVTAVHERDGRPVAESRTRISNPYPREYRALAPNLALLAQASRLTGGRRDPTPQEVFAADGESIETHEDLWPRLLFVALALFLLDILLRRVRLFDRKFGRASRRAILAR